MSHRSWRVRAALVLGVLTTALVLVVSLLRVGGDGGVAEAAVPHTRPNVVVVLTDDMRADDLRYLPRTRRLMGAGGMRFRDAVSPHPLCCPARAELLTGQYAQNNGVRHNSSRFGGYPRLDGDDTVATWFSAAGYRTAFVGKYLNGYTASSRTEPGWTRWDAISKGVVSYFDFRFHDGTTYTDDYVTRRIEERTNSAVEAFSEDDEPFLVYANHVAPHDRQDGRGLSNAPAEPGHEGVVAGKVARPLTDPAWGRRVRGGLPGRMTPQRKPASHYQEKWEDRIEALRSVDKAVESLYRTLARTGELDDTYVVFTSDNGYVLGEHLLYRKNLLVEEALSVPLLVTGPGVRAGSRSGLPVTLVDLVATLTDLTGVRPHRTLDGRSFAPTLRDREQPWRDTTLIQTGDETGRRTAQVPRPGWGMRGVRTDRYVYARDVNTGERLLFDHRRDPHELVNQARNARYRAVVRELDRRTDRLLRCTGARCNPTFGKDPAPTRARRR